VSRHPTLFVIALIATAAFSATALASSAANRPKAGHYAGTTSEQGTVSFKLSKGAKKIIGFTTTDGYNHTCQFSGGVGGIPTFTVKPAAMKVLKSGSFTSTVKATLGGFSGTFRVKGKLKGSGARGTVTEVGSTCGSSASNPTTPDYLETFTAKRV
jgi:hypothetical protein